MDELKPCPFCGGEAGIAIEPDEDGDTLWVVECTFCGAEAGGTATKPEAIAMWNRRTAPENVRNLLDTIHDLRNENNRLRTGIERTKTAAPNKPLTLEELRQMDGEPVYMVYVQHERDSWMLDDDPDDYVYEVCHNGATAYARKPERSENDA